MTTDLRALLRDADMLKKIANAIYNDRNGRGCIPFGRRSRDHQDPYLKDARAAVGAILDAMEGGSNG